MEFHVLAPCMLFLTRHLAQPRDAWVPCIQVEPTAKPGVLDVWTLIDTAMHKMTLHVPRTMYVDVTAGSMHLLEGNARFAGAVRKVDRTLPCLLYTSPSPRD